VSELLFLKKMEKTKKKLVALTGAGISAESGFSTFRDSGGLWETYSVEDVCTPEGFSRDPQMVNDFYNGLRRQLLQARPNAGHETLAQMEQDFDVSVITQNVDDLHERAGSTRVIHLHGELLKVCSSRDKDNPHCIETLTSDRLDVLPGERAKDGSLLRPWIVFFGEGVPNLERAAEEVARADIFVIIGSSLNVYPAAGLVRYAPADAEIWLIDPKEVHVPGTRNVHVIQDVASRGVPRLHELLKNPS